MAKVYNWTFEDDGQIHEIKLTRSTWGKVTYNVDNSAEKRFKASFSEGITGIDQAIQVGNKDVRVVAMGKQFDLAVDGYYLTSKKPYIAKPKWVWAFVILCLLPLVLGFGALPVLVTFSGALFCSRVSQSSISKSAKIISCIGITLAVWALMVLLAGVAVNLRK